MAAQYIVTNLPHAYAPPCVPMKIKEKQNTEGLVSSLTSVLTATLCLTSSPGGPGGGTPPGLEWGTGTEYPEGIVTSLSGVWPLLHFFLFYSVRCNYSRLTMCIITDAYSVLGCYNIEDIAIINTDLIQKDILKQKHQLLLYNGRYFPQQKFFLFEKEFCNCWSNGNWEILHEIGHAFQQGSLPIFSWGHWLKEF